MAAMVAMALTVASCSGDTGPDTAPVEADDDSVDVTTTEPLTDAGAELAADADADAPMVDADSDASEGWVVSVEVVADGFAGPTVDTTATHELDPVAVGDPFGEFASCSGLRDTVGAYSLFVSGPDDISFVGVWTASAVDGPGTYDADLRVELDGTSYDATGTVTLADGLQRGEFVGFGPAGGNISGRFDCTGTESPASIELGPDDGVLDTIEVFALLRRGSDVRVVGLATDDTVLVNCPGASGGGGGTTGVVVSARGGAGIGSISEFELLGTTLELTVGDTGYVFDDVAVDGDATAGSFGATSADGVAIDGAYRCT